MPQRVPSAWHSDMQLPGKLLLSAAALLLLSLAFRFYRNRSPPPGKIPPGEQRENRDGDGALRRRRRRKDGGEKSGNGPGMRHAEQRFPRNEEEEEEEEEEGEEVGLELGMIPREAPLGPARTGRELGKKLGRKLGIKSESEAGVELGRDPGSRTGELGSELGKEPGSQPGIKPGNNPGRKPGTEAISKLITKPRKELGSVQANELGNKLGIKSGIELGSEQEPERKLGNQGGIEVGSELGILLGNDLGNKAGVEVGSEPGILLGSEPGSHDPAAVARARSSPAGTDAAAPSSGRSPGSGDARTEGDGCAQSTEQDPAGAGRSRAGSPGTVRTLSVTSSLGLLLTSSEAGSDTSYSFSSVAKIQVEESFIPERRDKDKDKDSPPRPGLRGKVYDYLVQSTSEAVSRRTSLPFVPAGTSQQRGERGHGEQQSSGTQRENPALEIPDPDTRSALQEGTENLPEPPSPGWKGEIAPQLPLPGEVSAGTTQHRGERGHGEPQSSGTQRENPALEIPDPNTSSAPQEGTESFPQLLLPGEVPAGTSQHRGQRGQAEPQSSGIQGENPALEIPDPDTRSAPQEGTENLPEPPSAGWKGEIAPQLLLPGEVSAGTSQHRGERGHGEPQSSGTQRENPTLEIPDPNTSSAPQEGTESFPQLPLPGEVSAGTSQHHGERGRAEPQSSRIQGENPALEIIDPNTRSAPQEGTEISPHLPLPGEVPSPSQVHLGNCSEVLCAAKARRLRALRDAALQVMSSHFLQVLRSPAIYGRLNAAERELLPELRSRGRPRLVVADVPQAEPGHRRGRLCYYDEDGDRWRQLCQLPAEVSGRGCAVCSMFNYLFVVPGWEGAGRARSPSRRVLCYDPLGDSWRDICPLRQARPRCQLLALDGHLYAIGGECLATVERYDPRRDLWAFAAALPRDTFAVAHAAATCHGDIFVTGGTLRSLLLRYDARGDSWAASPAVGDKDRTAALVSAHGFLYRFQLRRGAGGTEVAVSRCSGSARLWYRCGSSRPLPEPAGLGCAALGGLVHCLGRGFHLRFLADPDSPRFGAKELRPFPEPHGSLLPAVLVLPEGGTEPPRP